MPTVPRPAGRAQVCIIGGGGTGAALACDLSLRGLGVHLFERGELTSGTTGRHHGQLHSGARYAVADRAIARECWEESLVLRRLVPEAIEFNGGVFVALTEEEADYAPTFIDACREAGIPAREISRERALVSEPGLNPSIRRAVQVPDGTMDAFRLPLSFAAGARRLGASIRPFTVVLAIERSSRRATALHVRDLATGREERVEADYIVNAAGAWAGEVGALASVDVPVTPVAGTMLAVRRRLSSAVVSRLRPAGDGDIIVPQRGLSIVGSTQWSAPKPDGVVPQGGEIAALLAWADELIPAFSGAPLHAAWSAARPLAGRSQGDGRSLSRDFAVLDHGRRDGLEGFGTVVGGKATVLRAMAEKAADAVCAALGVTEPCRTREAVLPSWRDYYRD